jgi:NTP pyrophosphatase (non-canonical NTP hydrolase)
MTYYLYHIPGKKIGVTSNLNNRVTLIQGYKADEYEVLDSSDDIDYISDKEIELQKSYGYKVDRQKYNQLIKKSNQMKINATEQTSTFPYPVNKLKGNLMDSIGTTWKTSHGDFELTLESINWIMSNVKPSMYNDQRCYVYNKAFSYAFDNKVDTTAVIDKFQLIRDWAENRGLYSKGDAKTQYIKLQEEAGELAQAILKDDQPEVIDAIGDMVVVLTNLAHLRGVSIEHCIESAYNVINKRKGSMVNGTFVKETL